MTRPYDSNGTFMGCRGTAIGNFGVDPFVIQGIPFDSATTNRTGTRMGPNAVRQASMMLTDGLHPKYLVDPTEYMTDMGNMPVNQTSAQGNLIGIHSGSMKSLTWRGKDGMKSIPHLITIGGDHSITFPVLQAITQMHGRVQVVHIDAHTDCSTDNYGDDLGHGTWVRNSIDSNLIIPDKMFSIGVRAPTSWSAATYLEERGGNTISAEDAMAVTPSEMATRILLTLDKTLPTYLSFDIDGLDPAYAPGTGTPEIGGLSTAWCLSLIRALQGLNWVGMDLVEVAPSYDHSEITALAGATIIYNYVCMNLHKRGV